jgi:hypothetical protein
MSPLYPLFDWVRALWAGFRLGRTAPRFAACLESDACESFLELLLRVMSLALLVDRGYRQNIARYNVSYLFQSRDRTALAVVIFADGRMTVQDGAIAAPDITVTFKDNQALAEYLFNQRLDVIGAIVDNEVSYVGNPNYLRKLAHMAKHLQLKFAPAR